MSSQQVAETSQVISSFRGKTVIITGSSSGIGAAAARRFAELGANIVVTGRNEDGLKATKAACLEAGALENTLLVLAGDVTTTEFRSKLVSETVAKFGGIDVLVNNAGYNKRVDILSISDVELVNTYRNIFDCNIEAVIDLTKKCIPHLIQSKGNVVNISSVAGLRAMSANFLYGMSKAALDMFTKGMAHELGSKGVRVNSINPGPIDTPFLERAMAFFYRDGNENKIRQMMNNATALTGIGDAKDVANAIAFLASPEAKFITGSNLVVDGGMLVK